MSDIESGSEQDALLSRPEDDDHDLLTYGEVGARLSEEIQAEQDELAGWESRLAAGEQVLPELERCAARLASLRDALSRNRRQPITDDNFERFFGFRGQAQRNT